MALKTFKPYTPSRRFLTLVDKSEITKHEPEKSLCEPQKRTGGRNNHGEVTIWHRGGGHQRMYRKIDFRREKIGIPAKVASIEYDPNRSARIALLHYADGEKRYILHPVGLEVGMTVQNGATADILPGNALQIRHFRRARWCTTWNSRPAKARRWCVRPAARRSCSAKRATWRW